MTLLENKEGFKFKCICILCSSNLRLSYRYNTQGNQCWKSLCTAQIRELYALGVLHNDLYVIGGQMKLKNQYQITNCVEKYSMEQENWRNVAPLPVPLACHAVVTVKNRLYVMGGWTPQVRNTALHFSYTDYVACGVRATSFQVMAGALLGL